MPDCELKWEMLAYTFIIKKGIKAPKQSVKEIRAEIDIIMRRYYIEDT
jgi:hypothetical protein